MATDGRRETREEFEALLEPVLPRAYGVALHLTRNRADAEDLVQEAALLAFRGYRTFERGTNFGAWFLRVLTNAFLSARRRKRPEDAAVPLDEIPAAYIQRRAREVATSADPVAGPVEAADVIRTVMARLETEQVEAAIASLPEEFRVVATLYFLQDLSYQQIADIVGVPIGTVRSRLHRGRAILQKRLWEIAEDHGLVSAAVGGAGRR